MDYVIRKMVREDARAVSHVIAVTWNETYKGIINDEYLDNLKKNEEETAKALANNFNANGNNYYVLEVNREIAGFINISAADDLDFENCGELCAIYIISKYKGQGYGKALFDVAIKELRNMGFNKMIIGCLKGNLANEFYKHMGGKFIKTRIFEKLQMPENVYYFDCL